MSNLKVVPKNVNISFNVEWRQGDVVSGYWMHSPFFFDIDNLPKRTQRSIMHAVRRAAKGIKEPT